MTTTRASRWRRRLLRAGLCLLLGAVTTVGVAWGCAWRPRAVDSAPAGWELRCAGHEVGTIVQLKRTATAAYCYCLHDRTVAGFERVEPDGAPSWAIEAAERSLPAAYSRDASSLPLPCAVREHHPWVTVPNGWAMVFSRAYGWPRLTLASSEHMVSRGGARPDPQLTGVVRLGGRSFPCRVVPSGLAIGSLFYAVPWWFVLLLPRAMLPRRRRRRGLCIACGYDLRGLAEGARCPECGT